MAGGNSTVCNRILMDSVRRSIKRRMLRENALLLVIAILAGVIVGIGAYGQRYRHRPFTRLVFLGATTLFLPITSSVVSSISGQSNYIMFKPFPPSREESTDLVALQCAATAHLLFVIIWAFLVQIVIINTSAIVAVDDREGQKVGPPLELLFQGLWTLYLGSYSYVMFRQLRGHVEHSDVTLPIIFLQGIPFGLLCAKIVLKYYAYEKAQQSFALGRNPCLVFGYMQQIPPQEARQHGEPIAGENAPPPPMLVMGEEARHVEKQPHGYVIKNDSGHRNIAGLVTIDRVWRFDSMLIPMSMQKRQKDLCFSFALFKLLRCRFAKYEVANARCTDIFNFFWNMMLQDGGHDRVFGVIADEISFLSYYYYTSIPVSFSEYWLPFMGIFISLLTIGYCILYTCMLVAFSFFIRVPEADGSIIASQFFCDTWCSQHGLVGSHKVIVFGRVYFDMLPLLLMFVLVTTAECNLFRHWDGKISQCSVMVPGPRPTLPVLLWRLLRLPDRKREVKIPSAVKVCIMDALRSNRNGRLSNGKASLHRQSHIGERFLWACDSKSSSVTILTWHIATSILELRYPNQQGSQPISDHKIAATHLSRYCAYLVAWCPELLPDDGDWSKSLYEDVKKDAERVLAGHTAVNSSTPGDLVELLIGANTKHEVLKNGAKLGKELVDLVEDEETAWKLLADFWSEMILYVAPSDNLKGHSEAIARGGELITLLWVLLYHVGIVSRPSEDDDGAATAAGTPSDAVGGDGAAAAATV
ncbi:hypothetical protein ACP70R_042006 [Stipagrostis hirtigluma subsp. patula]